MKMEVTLPQLTACVLSPFDLTAVKGFFIQHPMTPWMMNKHGANTTAWTRLYII